MVTILRDILRHTYTTGGCIPDVLLIIENCRQIERSPNEFKKRVKRFQILAYEKAEELARLQADRTFRLKFREATLPQLWNLLIKNSKCWQKIPYLRYCILQQVTRWQVSAVQHCTLKKEATSLLRKIYECVYDCYLRYFPLAMRDTLRYVSDGKLSSKVSLHLRSLT